jgi:hypothetical protein
MYPEIAHTTMFAADFIMPIHDWTRACDAAFHDFHLSWVSRLSAELNGGILPSPCYSLNETLEIRPSAELRRLAEPESPYVRKTWDDELLDVTDCPPISAFQTTDERRQYACPIVTIRDDLHQPIAVIVGVTRQDKSTPYRLDQIVKFAVGAITHGIHFLVIDVFPPSKRDPQGLHKLIWDRIKDEPYELPPGKPLTLASYSAGGVISAFVENVGVGDTLPDMPIFLTPERYVPCPLESTYQASWNVFPKALKGPLERTSE